VYVVAASPPVAAPTLLAIECQQRNVVLIEGLCGLIQFSEVAESRVDCTDLAFAGTRGGADAKPPTGISFIAESSHFAPIPSRNVPLITVTFSVVGCQCGAIFVPSVQESRSVYGRPAVIGSPCRTAIFTVPSISTECPYQRRRGYVHPLLRSRHHQLAARRAPALFFDCHLLRRRRLRHPRSYQQQAHNQHTNSLFRHGFISSALQVLTFL
jgi:hypothetical protein